MVASAWSAYLKVQTSKYFTEILILDKLLITCLLLLKSFSENSLKASRIIIPRNKLLNAHNSQVIRGKKNGSWQN